MSGMTNHIQRTPTPPVSQPPILSARPKSRGRPRLSVEFLILVGIKHAEEVERGGYHGAVKRLAERIDQPFGNVKRWIRLARERGLYERSEPRPSHTFTVDEDGDMTWHHAGRIAPGLYRFDPYKRDT